MTPATPSKESSPAATGTAVVVGSDAAIVPAGDSVTPVVIPAVAAEKCDRTGNVKADDVAIAMGKLEIEEKGKGKEVVREESGETTEAEQVKETYVETLYRTLEEQLMLSS